MSEIQILWFEGCPNHQAAREIVEDVLRTRGIAARVESIRIDDDAEARASHFPGSPTIRVGGDDIEPRFEDPGDYSLSCRVYLTTDGLRGIPERRWFEDALARAGM